VNLPLNVVLPFVPVVMLGALAPAAARGDGGVERLVAALRDDGVQWNATDAMDALRRLPEPPIAALQEALDSDDWQQRQIAASLLWEFLHPPDWRTPDEGDPRWWGEPQGRVTRRLLEVTVEGLRSDALPRDPASRRYTYVFNAADGFRCLSLHAHEARDLLEAGLSSGDEQQRFLCALALGFGGVGESAGVAAPILIPHLRDNDIHEDAKWSTAALYRFGPDVIPELLCARPDADEQQAQLIDLIILDLTEPPACRAELEGRRALNPITGVVFDPAIQPPHNTMSWLWDLSDSEGD